MLEERWIRWSMITWISVCPSDPVCSYKPVKDFSKLNHRWGPGVVFLWVCAHLYVTSVPSTKDAACRCVSGYRGVGLPADELPLSLC